MIRVLLAHALLLASLACGRSDVNVYEAHGEVQSVDLAQRQAVVAHEDIPGLMSAMTMSFDVPDEALLAQLAPGQHIDFELEVSDKSFRIIAARSADTRAGASRKPSQASALGANDRAPDFSLVDQSGAGVTMASLRGKILVVDFIFTHCTGPCPILTARNVELQRALDADLRERVRFVSISLDPANDTPEALTAYAAARGADLASWSFLTGPEADVAEVVRRFGVGTLRAPDGNIDHALVTFLVDPHGRIETRWLGLEHTVGKLREEVAELATAQPAAES